MENKYKQWDGICGYLRYKTPEGLLIDDEGTVYFIGHDGKPWIWCPASRLRIHLHRLYQICDAVEVIKK